MGTDFNHDAAGMQTTLTGQYCYNSHTVCLSLRSPLVWLEQAMILKTSSTVGTLFCTKTIQDIQKHSSNFEIIVACLLSEEDAF